MRIALVFNPDAPRARLARVAALERALGERGHGVSSHRAMTFRYASDAPDADLICVCGGDGTVRLVVDGQADLAALPPLAIYPTGTINLLARELGYPADPGAFAARIESEEPACSYPVAMAGGKRFLACASLGADAWAVAAVSPVLKARIGRLAYVVALARLLWTWPRGAIRVEADGEAFAAEALFVLRGRHYAGPWTLDREANLARDRLHVLALPRAGRRDLLDLIRYAVTGARRPGRHWRFLRVTELLAEADAAMPLQLDGDAVATGPCDFRFTGQRVRWK